MFSLTALIMMPPVSPSSALFLIIPTHRHFDSPLVSTPPSLMLNFAFRKRWCCSSPKLS